MDAKRFAPSLSDFSPRHRGPSVRMARGRYVCYSRNEPYIHIEGALLTEPAVVLDAFMSTELALSRLSHYASAHWCVIRDETVQPPLWHVARVGELVQEIESADPALPLGRAIDRVRHRAQVRRFFEPSSSRTYRRHTVVLDGTEVVGILPAMIDSIIPGLYYEWIPLLHTAAYDRALGSKFLAWPKIEAPSTANPGDELAITITLSREQGASPQEIQVDLRDGETQFDLQIDVAAAGFDAPSGWRSTMHVDRLRELPSISIPLRVRGDAAAGRTLIHVCFLKDGIVCGNATASIAILSNTPVAMATVTSPCLLPMDDELPPDLLVMIRKADDSGSSGRYLWSMRSTRAAIDPTPVLVDLGDDARTFARALMRDLEDHDDTALLEPVLRSIGSDIAAMMPATFWTALQSIAAAIAPEGRPPAVLFYSAEEFVPWELAILPAPLEAGPPYLGAQAVVGRWLHSQSGAVPPSPPSSISVRDIAVLAPDYENTGHENLTFALAEAKHMVDTYGAIEVDATEDEVGRLLDAQVERRDGSPAEIHLVHFACHGKTDPTRPGDAGLYLVNGRRLSPRVFGASTLGSRNGPLLFINACQAGAAQRLLALNSGFAGISLRGGFRAFIAPLWSVADEPAGAVAHRFYEATLGNEGLPVGDVLRAIRRSSAGARQSTFLSYVFYGHPRLRLHH